MISSNQSTVIVSAAEHIVVSSQLGECVIVADNGQQISLDNAFTYRVPGVIDSVSPSRGQVS